MTDQYRAVVRIERDRTPGYPAADATFFECGHMYRFAAGLGPPIGAKRYCHACTHAADAVLLRRDETMKTPEEQAAFEHARKYGNRWYESHRITACDAFLAGVKWAREHNEDGSRKGPYDDRDDQTIRLRTARDRRAGRRRRTV